MPRPRMYEPGDTVDSLAELLYLLHIGRYVYMFANGKPSHPSVVRQQKLAALEQMIAAKRIRRAIVRDEWVAWIENRKPRMCDECDKNPAEPGWKICVGCHAYRDHTGAI